MEHDQIEGKRRSLLGVREIFVHQERFTRVDCYGTQSARDAGHRYAHFIHYGSSW